VLSCMHDPQNMPAPPAVMMAMCMRFSTRTIVAVVRRPPPAYRFDSIIAVNCDVLR
jgi:hypothetical protein